MCVTVQLCNMCVTVPSLQHVRDSQVRLRVQQVRDSPYPTQIESTQALDCLFTVISNNFYLIEQMKTSADITSSQIMLRQSSAHTRDNREPHICVTGCFVATFFSMVSTSESLIFFIILLGVQQQKYAKIWVETM